MCQKQDTSCDASNLHRIYAKQQMHLHSDKLSHFASLQRPRIEFQESESDVLGYWRDHRYTRLGLIFDKGLTSTLSAKTSIEMANHLKIVAQ
ncbi:MAG TPA: hypothetical protein DEF45_17680 [Rhodopirellula sp.]|nr:hypothetical protein [Rhodopirellula sp.]